MDFTNKDGEASDSIAPIANDARAGTPVEIEITPEMVAAGCRELYLYHYDNGNEEEVVENIFNSMYQIRKR